MGWLSDFWDDTRDSFSSLERNFRRQTSRLDDNLRAAPRRLEDEVNETYDRVEGQFSELFHNPWDWATNTFLPNPIDEVVGYGESLLGLGEMPGIPGAMPPPVAPKMDDARARLLAENRKRKGAGSTILSERPSTPLGYTGGGTVSNILLGSS